MSLGKVGLTAAVLVLVAGAARAWAADVTVRIPPGLGSLFELLIQAGGMAILGASLVIILTGGRERVEDDVTGAPVEVKPVTTRLRPRWRVVFAAASGVCLAIAYYLASRLLAPTVQGAQPEGTNKISGPPEGPISVGALGHSPSGTEIGIYVAVACIAVATLAVAFLRMRSAGHTSGDGASEADGLEAVAELVRVGKAAVSDRTISDPREAVIACFDSMERALGAMSEEARPRDADTPQEVLHRAIDVASLPQRPAQKLLALFHRAQFSSHPMDDDDRTAAEAVLDELLDSCGLAAAGPEGARRESSRP